MRVIWAPTQDPYGPRTSDLLLGVPGPRGHRQPALSPYLREPHRDRGCQDLSGGCQEEGTFEEALKGEEGSGAVHPVSVARRKPYC